MTELPRICLIGFGEVGQILAADLAAPERDISAWDIKFPDAESVPSRALSGSTVRAASGAADAARGAALVISAVTAAQAAEAARAAAGGLGPGAFFLDLNSASPGMKQEAAGLIEAAGGRYVEAAVMSPVPPRRLAAPILLGGPHAADFLPLARELGFEGMRVYCEEVGRASAAKLCRSVMVKGLEALLTESLLTARHYGVENDVLVSLSDLLPGIDWPTLARYMISRTLTHGARRAEEMREAARTVAEAGVAPLMSAACAERQDWAARRAHALTQDNLNLMLDAMRAAPDIAEEKSAC